MRHAGWIQIAAAAVLAAAAACAPAPRMQAFSSTEGRFTVQMPGAVQQQDKVHQFKDGRSGIEHQFMVTTNHNHVAYMVMYNDLPKGPPVGTEQRVLDHVRDAVTAGKTLVSDSQIQLNGVQGRAIVARGGNGTVYQFHEFVDGARFYQLIVTVESGYTADQLDPFMKSFRIL
jgi:hypothetical protein